VAQTLVGGAQFRHKTKVNVVMSITLAPPPFDPRECIQMYQQRQFEPLTEKFLQVIGHFKQNTLYAIDLQSSIYINTFMTTFCFLFTQPDFTIAEKYVMPLLRANRTVANLAAMSAMQTTDVYIELLRPQQGNFVKILTLYSPRNKVKFSREDLFNLQPELASMWYLEYASQFYSVLVSESGRNNLRDHFNFKHRGLVVATDFQEPYFGSTYVDGKCDRSIKETINAAVQRHVNTLGALKNNPNPNKIAVMSTCWTTQHSVYRTISPYIRALKPKYHLTFFQLGNYSKQDVALFDEVRQIDFAKDKNAVATLNNNDFQVVIFPDLGMCAESILLANWRIAPIQMIATGHPVSSFGAHIDYFVSGADVESPDAPEQHYSERLLLLPGMGAVHKSPTYKIRGAKKTTDKFVINASWYTQKINYPFVKALRKLFDQSQRKCVLRIFIGGATCRANDHMPFINDFVSVFGSEGVEIYANLGYEDYMAKMEEGDLAIEPFHFGGSNTISDTLYLRIPTITWQGDRWYNRIGSQMLRLVGLSDCITTNEEQYISRILEMIHNDDAREDVRQRLIAADLNNTIYSTADAGYFLEAMDTVIAQHDRLKNDPDRSPLRIERRQS
jgi:hypothetical protein